MLVKDIEIITMREGKKEIVHGDVFIKDKIIQEIKPHSEKSKDKIVIDGIGKVLLPGFINCHTHSPMILFRGVADDVDINTWFNEYIWRLEKNETPDDIYWGAKLAIAEMLLSGTTTFLDMYFHMDKVAKAVEELGIRAFLAWTVFGVGEKIEEKLKDSINFIKNYDGTSSGRIRTVLNPHSTYTCPPSFLSKVAEIGKDLDNLRSLHLCETKEQVEESLSNYGKSPVQICLDTGIFDKHIVAAHAIHINEEDLKVFKEKDVRVAHCPECNSRYCLGIAPIAQMVEMGIKVGLGTDGAASNNNLDMLDEIKLAAILQKVKLKDPIIMSNFEVLKMATYGGAQVLGIENELGSIEEGKKADVIIFDFNNAPHLNPKIDIISNIVYSAKSSDISHVIVDGKLIVDNRKIIDFDMKKSIDEVNLRSKRLLEQKGELMVEY